MRTRHLYGIFTGPSFAGYSKAVPICCIKTDKGSGSILCGWPPAPPPPSLPDFACLKLTGMKLHGRAAGRSTASGPLGINVILRCTESEIGGEGVEKKKEIKR
jgi:hypothetical protein